MKRIHRFVSLLIALMIIASAPVHCALADGESWIVSDLMGSVTADTDVALEDDFHAFVNREWLATAEIPEGHVDASPFLDRELEVQEQIELLMTDETQTSHEAQLVQTLYAQYTDMDARNALGMEPVKVRIDDILALETLDDVTQYILQHESNKASTFVDLSMSADFVDSSVQRLWLAAPAFFMENADEYRETSEWGAMLKDAYGALAVGLLTHAGLSEEEAVKCWNDAFEFETLIAQASMGLEATLADDYPASVYNPVTLAELEALSPVYPIAGILKPFVDAGVDSFILSDPGWLAQMNEIYTEENVEQIKAYLICDIAFNLSYILDQTCLDLWDEWTSTVYGMEVKTDVEDVAYNYCSNLLDMLVGRMYSDAYVTEETKANVEAMVDGVVTVYRGRLENCSWLSEETRQMALRKLDNLTVRVAYPNDWSRYETAALNFAGNDAGGDLISSCLAIDSYFLQYQIDRLTTPTDGGWWITTPQAVNAFYDAGDNSINIPAGILGGAFYDPQAPDETNMGRIGMIIAHEITHAFDDFGSQYDEKGNFVNWWTEADYDAFYARLSDVSAYFSQFEVLPGLYVNGDLVVGEAVADLGALSCMLEIARAEEDFDYALFFEGYAAMWRELQTAAGMEDRVRTDPHPPQYLRTNAIVQQFEEFYETYGIVEGDGMYLAPEARLSVW